MVEGKPQCQGTAERMAAEHHAPGAERIEQLDEARNRGTDAVRLGLLRGVGIAVAEQFRGDDREAPEKRANVRQEGCLARGETVEEDDGWAGWAAAISSAVNGVGDPFARRPDKRRRRIVSLRWLARKGATQ